MFCDFNIVKVAKLLGLRPRPRWGSLQRSPIPHAGKAPPPLVSSTLIVSRTPPSRDQPTGLKRSWQTDRRSSEIGRPGPDTVMSYKLVRIACRPLHKNCQHVLFSYELLFFTETIQLHPLKRYHSRESQLVMFQMGMQSVPYIEKSKKQNKVQAVHFNAE